VPQLFGCSCFSGFSGDDCSTDARGSCAGDAEKRQSATSSEFVTEIDGSIDASGIHLSIEAPVEHVEGDLDGEGDAINNYATWTTMRFKNEDHCDYPEGDLTDWTKAVETTGCTETFSSVTDVSQLLGCTGIESVFCKNSTGGIIDCDPEDCDVPPCTRCYPGQLLATRGYIRTSNSGDLTAVATAENCHYFEVCLPWIQSVESEIEVTLVPEFNNSFILTRVAFSCFDNLFNPHCVTSPSKAWLIEIKSVANYPWFVEEDGTDSGHLHSINGNEDFSLFKQIVDGPGCNVSGELCVQTFQFKIPGCTSLEDLDIYNLVGFSYNCYGDCSDALDAFADELQVEAAVTLQATQDQCGEELTIEPEADAITLAMNTFLDNYEDSNVVYVEDDDVIGNAYFKVLATSSVPIDHLNLIKFTAVSHLSSDSEDDLTRVFAADKITIEPMGCPEDAVPAGQVGLCFYVSVNDFFDDFLDSDLVSVDITAQVEIVYVGEKRGLGSEYSLHGAVRVVPVETEDGKTTNSASAALALVSMFLVYLF
jgi:hypothetical protein